MDITIDPAKLEEIRQRRLQDEATIKSMQDDPDDPANICISCE